MAQFIEDDDVVSPNAAAAVAVAAAPAATAVAVQEAPAAAVTAAVPPPAQTTSTPTQVQGPAAPAPTPTAPKVTAAVAAEDFEDVPVATKQTASAGQGKASPVSDDDLDVNLGDEKLMSRSDGLDILRPEKGQVVRFSPLFVHLSPKRAFNHYIEKKGTYRCLSTPENTAVCCQKLGESQPQIVALVLHYTNADKKTGKYPVLSQTADGKKQYAAIEWDIKFVRLSKPAFQKLSRLVPEDQDAKDPDLDIIMFHRDNGIGYDFSTVSAARWKRNPELVKEVTASVQPLLKDNAKKLVSKLGKKVTALEFKAVIAGTQASESADMANIEDIN